VQRTAQGVSQPVRMRPRHLARTPLHTASFRSQPSAILPQYTAPGPLFSVCPSPTEASGPCVFHVGVVRLGLGLEVQLHHEVARRFVDLRVTNPAAPDKPRLAGHAEGPAEMCRWSGAPVHVHCCCAVRPSNRKACLGCCQGGHMQRGLAWILCSSPLLCARCQQCVRRVRGAHTGRAVVCLCVLTVLMRQGARARSKQT